jgi:hypothetical protein
MNWAASFQIMGILFLVIGGALLYANALIWLEQKYRWGTWTLMTAVIVPFIVIGSLLAGLVVK